MLLYKKIFNAYHVDFWDRLGMWFYNIYLSFLKFKKKRNKLSKTEEFHLDSEVLSDLSKKVPTKAGEVDTESTTELFYLDFYDYCTKENLNLFLKQLKTNLSNSPRNMFYGAETKYRFEEILKLQGSVDNYSMHNLSPIKVENNENIDSIQISLFNLSSSLIAVRYRFRITQAFNEKLKGVLNKQYEPDVEPVIHLQDRWYKPKRFGKIFYDGDHFKKRDLYYMISKLKWSCYLYIKHYYTLYYTKHKKFLPCFEVFYTDMDISGGTKDNVEWLQRYFGFDMDYSEESDYLVCFNDYFKRDGNYCITSFVGGRTESYNSDRSLVLVNIDNKYVSLVLSSLLGAYLHAKSIRYNKLVSNRLRYNLAGKLLKLRLDIEKRVYYPYRFAGEFSGNTLIYDEINSLDNLVFPQVESFSKIRFGGITDSIAKSKRELDLVLKNLDDAVVFSNYKINKIIQVLMLIATILSLVVTALSVKDGVLLNRIIEVFKCIR